ncbi:NAD-dependent epimerase/dehydratase family protein [Shewanella sp. 0m-4]
MKILLTGSGGFIGSYLYARNPSLFRCVVRNNPNLLEVDNFFIDAFSSKTIWNGAFDDIDSVLHLAGIAHSKSSELGEYRDVNLFGTLHLAREAANSGVKRFIFVSSILVNGRNSIDGTFSIDSKPNPQGDFANYKFQAEEELKKISNETGMELVIIRPTLVYGPNAPGNFGLLKRLVQKSPVLPFGLSKNKRDFISLQNLGDLLLTCANHPNAAGHIFLASDGMSVSIKEFTNAIARGLGKPLIQLPIPISLISFASRMLGKSEVMEQLFGNLQVDSSNAQEILSWAPPYTMEQAMASLSEKTK